LEIVVANKAREKAVATWTEKAVAAWTEKAGMGTTLLGGEKHHKALQTSH